MLSPVPVGHGSILGMMQVGNALCQNDVSFLYLPLCVLGSTDSTPGTALPVSMGLTVLHVTLITDVQTYCTHRDL